ncbi:MAG: cupin domain-containing protein [Planctomycetaceae bacterium]|nr:cupin domain-containing protein [Planctomycetaceae bacterium]
MDGPFVGNETTEVLFENESVRIERIVSYGHTSAPGFWYDQDELEWVTLLAGEARLLFEGETSPLSMAPGDQVTIPAHRRHRVEWTTPREPTVWLAVFIRETNPPAPGSHLVSPNLGDS